MKYKLALLCSVLTAALLFPACDLIKEASGGLEFCDCTERPFDVEHNCNVSKLQCNNNAREWCQVQKDTPEDECLAQRLMSCEARQKKCLEAIKRCPAGKTCKDCQCK